MTEPQLVIVDDDGNPALWPCNACNGVGSRLRLLYPDEREPGGAFVVICHCRTCGGSGTLDYDPHDLSVFAF